MHSVLLDFMEKVSFVYYSWFWIYLIENTKLHLSDVFKEAHFKLDEGRGFFSSFFLSFHGKGMYVLYSNEAGWTVYVDVNA